ncbi:MAG: DUF1385 domain-containing protein [Fibrobacterota bacterium]|nr:DUF1385 domain-containing protein [Chitinispirillaceae bacterium]
MNLKQHLFFVTTQISGLLSAEKKNTVGGQALIEGVMMRGKEKISLAVRRGPDDILIEEEHFVSVTKKYPILKLPVLRGTVNLFESMVVGYKTLSRSADIITEAENAKDPTKKQKKTSKAMESFYSILSLVISLVIAFGLFMYAPMWLISQIVPKESALLFNTLAGIFRIALLIGYMALISMWKDVRRVFEYHGAEHKAIFTYEDGKELTIDNMKAYTTLHPRCGTSFLFLVGFICILLFSIVDAVYIMNFGPFPNIFTRFLLHIALIPIVSGTSYEVLKLSDKYQHIPLIKAAIMPGLWLQKITTKNPDETQLEVAAKALKAAI